MSAKAATAPPEAHKMSASFKSRVEKTLSLMDLSQQMFDPYLEPGRSFLLDLGPDNTMRQIIEHTRGHMVRGTGFVDLDLNWHLLKKNQADAVTAFEIIEHLRNPFMVLESLQAPVLIASVPLSVWFSRAYWNSEDEFDTHFHEFEPKQFRSLLEKTGWRIRHEEKWKWGPTVLKPRPLIRKFGPWPSWMAVICERA